MAVQLEKPMAVCDYLALDNEPPWVTGYLQFSFGVIFLLAWLFFPSVFRFAYWNSAWNVVGQLWSSGRKPFLHTVVKGLHEYGASLWLCLLWSQLFRCCRIRLPKRPRITLEWNLCPLWFYWVIFFWERCSGDAGDTGFQGSCGNRSHSCLVLEREGSEIQPSRDVIVGVGYFCVPRGAISKRPQDFWNLF